MSSTGHLPELESLRSQVADLARELTERDQAMQIRQQGIDGELEDLRKQSDLLRTIMEGTAADTGDDFVASLATHLTTTLRMQYAVIGELLDGTPASIRTLAVSSGGHLLDNFECDLAQAPCGTGLTESFWCFEQGVQTLFPNFPPLASMGMESHSGVSIRDKQGNVIGLIVVMDTQPIASQDRLQTLLKIFAARVAAELHRKQAEVALQEQTRRLAHAQSLAHLGSWDWDIESGETDWSEEQFRIFGHEPGAIAVTYDTFLAALLPDDHDRVLAAVNDALLGKSPLDLECRIVRPNGDIRVIHMRADVQRDATAHPVGMAGTALDITERKQTEEALRTSEERWHLAVQGSHDGIWDWNIQAGAIFFSARWKAMRGFADHDVSNHIDEWRSRIHPDDLDHVLQSIDHYLAKQTSAFCEEYRVQRKDGSYMWILDRGAALWAEDGTPLRMAGSESDITKRKRAEDQQKQRLAELAESQTHFEQIFHWTPSAVAISTLAEGRFLAVNDRLVQLTGYAREELIGHTTSELRLWVDPPERGRVIQEILQQQSLHNKEGLLRTKTGERRTIMISVDRIQMHATPCLIYVAHDITERKQAEALLHIQTQVLELVASDAPLHETLDTLVRLIEAQSDGMLGSILLLNEEGRHLRHGASPSLPDEYTGAIDGLAIGPSVGSCGTAAFRRERIIVEDIATDPLWEQYRDLALPHGLRACWSTPIVSKDTLVFGTFAMYYREPRRPSPHDLQLIEYAARLAAVAIERMKKEKALRESEERYRTLVELSPSGVFVFSEGQTVYVNPMAMTILGATEPSDILARAPFEFIHPDYHEDVTKNLRRVLAGETTVHRAERIYLKMDGTPIHVQVEAVRITWNGKPAIQGFFSDITERKRAREELRRAKTRLRYILENNPAVVYTRQVGNGWPFTFITPNVYELLGYTSIDILTDPDRLDQTIHPDDDRDMMTTGMPQLLSNGAQTFVYRLRRRDGRYCWIENRARLTDDGHGTLQIVGTMLDITQRKQAEEALTTSERQLRTVLDSLPIGVWFTDEHGHVLYGNPVGHRIWAEAARVGLPQPGGDELWWETIAQPESPHRWAVGTVLARGQDVQNETLAIETRAGARRTIRNSAVPVKSDTGEMLGAIVLNEDITDRVRAEKALHQEHALLMAVMDAATDIIFVKDLEGRYIHINRAGAHALGMAVEEVIGWNDYAIWPSELAASCQVADRRVLETGEPVTVEEISVCNGLTTIYLTTKAPYRNSEGQIIGVIGVARDVTEQKHAEEALRASEQLFAKAFRASPNPISITEVTTGRCLDTNQACLDLLGFPREEVVGQTTLILSIWPNPQDRDMLISRLQTSGAMHNEEMTFRTKSGTLRHVLVSSDLVEMNGKTCLITVGNDITERIRAEEALREQHALLSAIMNTTMDIIFVKDLQGHYLHMNPAGARVVGLSPQEIVGKDDDAMWPADLAACCKETDRQISATGSAQTMEESTLANGKRTTYLTTKAPYRDAAGNMIGIIGVAHNISQIKQSEEDLRRSHAFIRQIIDTDPNFIFAKDREGRFTLVNKAVADAYGTSVEQLIGKTDADVNTNTRELEFFRKHDLEVLDSLREQFIPEEMMTDTAGHTRWLQTVKRPILDESGKATMVLGASTDITERKRMEETLRQRERDLRSALDERERISQDLHDGILQSLYAVGLGLEACKPLMTQRHYKKAAASMDRAIGHLNHVMSEVRNFIAGLESQILQGSTFPMALRTMVLTLTADHPIPCTLTIDESLADTFSTEQALHLLHVVREALSNSRRHAEATKTTVSLKSLSRSIRLTIADNGRGFDPASLRGAGHGLTNMEARARKVGGRFAVRSVPQYGTRITIDIPKETRHAESERAHGSPAARR